MSGTHTLHSHYRTLRSQSPHFNAETNHWHIADYHHAAALLNHFPAHPFAQAPFSMDADHITSATTATVHPLHTQHRADFVQTIILPLVATLSNRTAQLDRPYNEALLLRLFNGEITTTTAQSHLMATYHLSKPNAETLLHRLIAAEQLVGILVNGFSALLSHPKQLALLKVKRRYLSAAIVEMLRYAPPLHRLTFTVQADTIIDALTLRTGQRVDVYLAAANRDPNAFRHADIFDMTQQRKHAPLISNRAIIVHWQLEALVNGLLDALPRLQLLTAPAHLPYLPTDVLRRPREMPVVW